MCTMSYRHCGESLGVNLQVDYLNTRVITTYVCSYHEQARKAHSSAFCIDLNRQTLISMIGNFDNDGQ